MPPMIACHNCKQEHSFVLGDVVSGIDSQEHVSKLLETSQLESGLYAQNEHIMHKIRSCWWEISFVLVECEIPLHLRVLDPNPG